MAISLARHSNLSVQLEKSAYARILLRDAEVGNTVVVTAKASRRSAEGEKPVIDFRGANVYTCLAKEGIGTLFRREGAPKIRSFHYESNAPATDRPAARTTIDYVWVDFKNNQVVAITPVVRNNHMAFLMVQGEQVNIFEGSGKADTFVRTVVCEDGSAYITSNGQMFIALSEDAYSIQKGKKAYLQSPSFVQAGSNGFQISEADWRHVVGRGRVTCVDIGEKKPKIVRVDAWNVVLEEGLATL